MKIKKHITALATAAALSATLPAVAQQSQHMAPETMLSLARVGASALSPDGKTVVYSVGFPSIKDNKIRTELFTISSDGSARRQITQGVAGVHGARWIQQGRRISYISSESGAPQVWTMAPDGTDRRQVTNIEGGSRTTSSHPMRSSWPISRRFPSGRALRRFTPTCLRLRVVSSPI